MQDAYASRIWAPMPPDLKRLSCPPVRFPGLTLFHKRVPDAVVLAF